MHTYLRNVRLTAHLVFNFPVSRDMHFLVVVIFLVKSLKYPKRRMKPYMNLFLWTDFNATWYPGGEACKYPYKLEI